MSGVPKAMSLAGRYVLFDEIASGGMASVHFGRLIGSAGGFSRSVAIKRLHAQFAKAQEFAGMLMDEARVAARVRHPNVVPVLDVASVDGELFIVMEYVHGLSLAHVLKLAYERNVTLSPTVVAAIVSNVLHGLHAAHEAQSDKGTPLSIVHRDVSPQNVLVGADGVARVVDFGIAKAEDRLQITRDGRIKGKLHYMSPEQLDNRPLDRRSDIYSVGVLLWEALTGHRLFEGVQDIRIMAQMRGAKVTPPSRHVPLPPGLDEVVLRALARSPEERYFTAKEMALALERTVGVATTSEVGDLVGDLGKIDLAARSAAVASIERLSTDEITAAASPGGVSAAGVPTKDDTAAAVTRTTMTTSSRMKWLAGALSALILLAFTIALSVAYSQKTQNVAGSAPPSAAPTVKASVARVETRAAPSASETIETLQPVPVIDVTLLPKQVDAQTSPNTTAKPKSCNPPWEIDAKGIRHLKRECMQ